MRQAVKLSPVMQFTRYFLPLLFSFALLLTQQGGIEHTVQHLLQEHSHEHSLPHDKLCERCAVYAQVGSALNSGTIFFAALELPNSFVAVPLSSFHASRFSAFAARAPPRSA